MKVYTGKGIANMMKCAARNGLTKTNSISTIKNPGSLDSEWRITKKE